jgi:uncharacterized protein YjbJ (UPF0337 family)
VETVQRQLKEKWGKLTDDDLEVIGGRRQILVGKIQEYYREKQVDDFVGNLNFTETAAKVRRARRS